MEDLQVQVGVRGEFATRLKCAALNHGLSIAEVARRALLAYLPQLEAHEPLPGPTPDEVAKATGRAL